MANRSAAKTAGSKRLEPKDLEAPFLRDVLASFGDAHLPNHVVAATAVFRAEKVIKSKMAAALASLDLAPERFQVLGLLATSDGGRMSLSELSRAVLLHPATTTYTVDALEKRGLVQRQNDPRDRRGVLAEITPAGRDLVRRGTKLLELAEWGVSELSEEDAAAVARVLSRLHPS